MPTPSCSAAIPAPTSAGVQQRHRQPDHRVPDQQLHRCSERHPGRDHRVRDNDDHLRHRHRSEVDTLAALTTALGNISGISASIDSTTGYLTVSADSASTSFTLSGTGGPAAFGLSTATQSSTTTANGTRTAAETQFNALLTQINDLAADASFNGNNLLTGDDLTVIFNEDGSSSLDISGVTFTSTGLGISAVTTGDFQTNANIHSTLSQLDSAIATLRTQAATFGSNLSVVQIRQDFTRQLIDVLETGAGNLTLADTNREGANLLALQTRQQLSSTSLGIAARADQAVLQLLR
jgi:flagellin